MAIVTKKTKNLREKEKKLFKKKNIKQNPSPTGGILIELAEYVSYFSSGL